MQICCERLAFHHIVSGGGRKRFGGVWRGLVSAPGGERHQRKTTTTTTKPMQKDWAEMGEGDGIATLCSSACFCVSSVLFVCVHCGREKGRKFWSQNDSEG